MGIDIIFLLSCNYLKESGFFRLVRQVIFYFSQICKVMSERAEGT